MKGDDFIEGAATGPMSEVMAVQVPAKRDAAVSELQRGRDRSSPSQLQPGPDRNEAHESTNVELS